MEAGRARQLSHRERIGLSVHRGLDKWLTPLGIWMMRRTQGGLAQGRLARMLGAPRDVHVLLLTTRGHRSGKTRTVILQFFPDGEEMIVTAANDGGSSHPSWYFNLKSDPSARVEIMGRVIQVRAEELPADAAADWWQRILLRSPSYELYQRATNRTFPVLRLIPQPRPTGAVPQATET